MSPAADKRFEDVDVSGWSGARLADFLNAQLDQWPRVELFRDGNRTIARVHFTRRVVRKVTRVRTRVRR